MANPTCPHCRRPMEPGAVMERGSSFPRPQVWMPEGRSLIGDLRVEERGPYDVLTYRCPRCGLLGSYAPV
jgi:hypothetical protein